MFSWQKQMKSLDLPASKVLRLFRSLVDVQVALPGLPAQEARAYIVAHASGSGCRSVVALHLLSNDTVAYFVNDSGDTSLSEVDRLIHAALNFAESMGFMLGDLDYQLLDPEQQQSLWNSLPLRNESVSAGGGKAAPTKTTPLVVSETLSKIPSAPVEAVPKAKTDERWRPDGSALLSPDRRAAVSSPAAAKEPTASGPTPAAPTATAASSGVPGQPPAASSRPPALPAEPSAAQSTSRAETTSEPSSIVTPDARLTPELPTPAELEILRQHYRQQLGRLLASF